MSRQTAEPVPVAPVRDFTKVANSIAREAIPAGLFTGKSKQLYDCLYALTRGAVAPSRTVRLSRSKLMKRASIGARVTFDANVERLIMVGLVQVRRIAGEHDGNEYTVFLPDEVSLPSPSSMPSQTSLTEYTQNLDGLDGLDSSQTRHTLSVENTGTSDLPQTSFKTRDEKLDDELSPSLLDLAKIFNEANRMLTGKPLNPGEREKWTELARVLVAELEIAAARTTVSSVPSFLAEHLRRRLWKMDKKQARAEGRELPDAPSAVSLAVNAKDCPDCGGSGFWYPEGYEKGVAKCKHEKLIAST